MALIPEDSFAGRIEPASNDYPYGKAVDRTTPGTGTPFRENLVNDLFGFQQALLADAGITPTGLPDTATESQYLEAVKRAAIKSQQLTTDELILSDKAYSVGTVITTSGYASSGDGRGAQWQFNGVTGQTPSQSPAQLGDAKLTDASGNEFELTFKTTVNPDWLGADPSLPDNKPYFQAALNWLMSNGGGALRSSGGDYSFASRLETAVDLGNGAFRGLAIIGAGRGATVLRVKNGTGLFKWENLSARDINLTLEDFTVAYDNGGNCGNIFEIYSVPGGNHHHRDLFVQNVAGIPQDASVDYVDRFFFCTGLWRPHFHSVTSTGPFGLIPESTQKQGVAVFDVPDCYAPTFERCYAWGCTYGYRSVITENPGGEGFTAVECVADSDIGFYRSSTGKEPAFNIKLCHANCNTAGVRLDNVKLCTISDCLFYNEESTAYTDIDLINCDDVVTSNNIYHFAVNPLRTMINVDANCSNVFIENEKFRAQGTAINLELGCDEVSIIKPWFNSDVDTPINDQGATNLHVTHRKRWRASASKNVVQAIADNATTAVIWDVEDTDLGGWFTAGGETFTVPPNLGIKLVKITAAARWGNNSTGVRVLKVNKNGAGFLGEGHEIKQAASTSNQQVTTGAIEVSDGDIFRVQVLQTSGVSQNLVNDNSTWFKIEAVDS